MRTKDGFAFRVPVPNSDRKSYSSRILAGSLRQHMESLKRRSALAGLLIESAEEILRSKQERLESERES